MARAEVGGTPTGTDATVCAGLGAALGDQVTHGKFGGSIGQRSITSVTRWTECGRRKSIVADGGLARVVGGQSLRGSAIDGNGVAVQQVGCHAHGVDRCIRATSGEELGNETPNDI